MKVGIVSDSHGKADRLARAIDALTQRGARTLVHCGDLGSAACLELLARPEVQAYAVAGNMDRRSGELARAAGDCGVTFHPDCIEAPLDDGQYLAATHGHNVKLLDELILGGQFPYVCHGHTHLVRDETRGRVRILCPGALRGPRRPRHPTAMLLDTATESLELIAIDR